MGNLVIVSVGVSSNFSAFHKPTPDGLSTLKGEA
jgi:hypothetical protein